jgi:hypothetical protein
LKGTTADNDANSRKKQEKEGGGGSKRSQKMSETARLFKVLKYATTCNSLYNEVKRECKQFFFLQCSPIVASRNFPSKMLF